MARQPLSQSFIKWMLLFADVAILFAAFNLAYYLRLKGLHPELLITKELFFILFIVLICSYVFDLYDPASQISGLRTPGRFIIATILSGALVALLIYALGGPVTRHFGRSVMLGTFTFFAIWGAASRYLMARWLKKRSQTLRWLVLGECEYLARFHKDFQSGTNQGSVSYLVKELPGPSDAECQKMPLLGTWDELDNHLRAGWSGVVVCAPSGLPEPMIEKLLSVRLLGTRVFNATDFYESQWFKVPIYLLDSSWILLSQGFGLIHNPIGLRLKRLFDVVASLLLIPLILPLLLVAAFLVLLESGFPIIFSQIRAGKDAKPFKIYKLRTMAKNAETQGAQWTRPKDKRVLLVGKLLRKFRVDELPQILNVLKGEMSFIGPRPERPEIIKGLEKNIPHYQLRHIVAPGITGWAQVYYGYGDSVEAAKEKLQFDLYYIKNYSVILDIAIIFKTLRTLIFGAGR